MITKKITNLDKMPLARTHNNIKPHCDEKSNIKEQIIQSQEQEKINIKTLLFDKLFDIKQQAEDLMAEIDMAYKYLANIVVLTDERQLELGSYSYAPYVNAIRFAELVTKILKKEGK